jgi:hypothetical protein
MAINFPNNPIDGNTYDYASVKYSYVDLGGGSGFWKTVTADSGPATSSEVDAGTSSDKYATPSSLEGSKYNSRGTSASRDVGTASNEISLNSDIAVLLSTLLPAGIITMWAGTVSSVPTGWFLCNGANGTPDLRGRFVYGASVDGDENDVGGSSNSSVISHNHTANHSHSASSNTIGNHRHTANHNHSASSNTTGNHAHSANHNHSAGSHGAGDHRHNHYTPRYSDNRYVQNSGGYAVGGGFNDNGGNVLQTPTSASTAGNHSHSVYVNNANVTTSTTGNHSHSITVNTNNFSTGWDGSHSHSITVNANNFSTSTVGSSGNNANLPPYMKLAYVMKG